ncbi:outer-membrane lipoprotein carrier protein LolA [Candidatus Pelagibacter sp.]|nr:outer-membrane lipoprotein carrier protein LolA [Candidatus Pelagibacter sp.]
MFRIIIIFIILNIYNPASSAVKEMIISQMKITSNLSFNFTQTIDNKSEKGKCIIKYPKKIYCKYDGVNKKIIVSNGKSLVIKIANQNNYNFYSLNRTPLEYLLDKNYLISKIKSLEPREIDKKYLNFTILERNNELNIFFDKENFNLIGWQIEDIFQNLSITFIHSVKINQNVDENIFTLPKNN